MVHLYLQSNMVHLYLPTTISYPIWSTSISYGPHLSLNHYLISDMVHLFSQPLSPNWYGPPLSPNHYLLSDMVHLLSPHHYLISDMVHLFISQHRYPIPYGLLLSHMVHLFSQPLSPNRYGPPLSSQPLSHIWYGPPLSSNHYLLSDMVQLNIPTTISYLIWVHLYLPYNMVHLYPPNPYLLCLPSISQPLSPIWYGPPLSPNHNLTSDMVHLFISQPLSHIR